KTMKNQCLSNLRQQFGDVEFRAGTSSENDGKNAFTIDKKVLEEMEHDPRTARKCEDIISLALMLQKALQEKGALKEDNKLVVLH
ncbi:MAG: hypothetical protein K2N20_06860, partial [Helicobacter sp.]|nr:hypothetical protein [Helicobacter sp.]